MFILRIRENIFRKVFASRNMVGNADGPPHIPAVVDGRTHEVLPHTVNLSPHMHNSGSDGVRLQPVDGSGLYVDVENIQDDRGLIESAINTWPDRFPKPTRLWLSVPADMVEMWRLWAADRFEDVDVIVEGIQRFSGSTSKNTADMAIATSAMADWILGRVSHVAVLSDDSDFISLYAAMRKELVRLHGSSSGEYKIRVPFLWVGTDRNDTRSLTATEFFPKEHLHIVEVNATIPTVTATKAEIVPTQDQLTPPQIRDDYTEMAREIARRIPVGNFKSTDCRPLIQRRWSTHPLATATGPTFGSEFKNKIGPILQEFGVEITGRNPVKYSMTQAAKQYAQHST